MLDVTRNSEKVWKEMGFSASFILAFFTHNLFFHEKEQRQA